MNKLQASTQSIKLKHKISDSHKLQEFLSQHIRPNNIPDETHHELRLAVEEIFTNIVNHADISAKENAITVELNYDSNKVIVTFIDTGKEFNPVCDHENGMHNNDHSEGGMGIHLIKTLTDHQEYKRIGQQNVFTVTKHYNN